MLPIKRAITIEYFGDERTPFIWRFAQIRKDDEYDMHWSLANRSFLVNTGIDEAFDLLRH